MRKMMRVSILLSCLFVLVNPLVSAETVRFGTFPIPGYVDDAEHGKFIEITRAMAERAGLDIVITVAPPKRMFEYFATQQVDVLFPAVAGTFAPDNQPIRSAEPISMRRDYIFTMKDGPMVTSIHELEGKTVGITAGYTYPQALLDNPRITLDAVSGDSDESNARKLEAGRIDAFVVTEEAGLTMFERLGMLDHIQYDPASPIATHEGFYAFQQTDQGKQLAERVSQILTEMKADGTFQRIMGLERE